MDSADRLLLTALLGGTAILVGGIGSCVGVVNHQDNVAMTAMVKNGTDALSAKCAIKGEGASGMCAIIAAKSAKP